MSSPELALRYAIPRETGKAIEGASEERSFALAFLKEKKGTVGAKKVALEDLDEVFELTKSFSSFDVERFENFLSRCVRSVEMSTQALTQSAVGHPDENQEKVTERFMQESKDPRAIAVDVYVWLVDILSLIHVAIQQQNDVALQDGLREAHERITTFLQETEAA